MKPKLCNYRQCTGCSSCYNKCPVGAISMEWNNEGFQVPVIESQKCVRCLQCEKACPILNPLEMDRRREPITYACWNNDSYVRSLSSSGGMFSVYADYILEQGGVVYGTAFDDKLNPVVVKAENKTSLIKFRSSKYVQSEVGSSFRKIEKDLSSGRDVLFVGTPCQVAGLYAFLKKDYPNLYTCDLICHGASSPVFYRKWLSFLTEKYNDDVISINMRSKKNKWKFWLLVVVLKSFPEKEIVIPCSDIKASYMPIFLRQLSIRSSCSPCPFGRLPRVGDITLGDFWGIGKKKPFPYPTEEGVSVNTVNSDKGEFLVRAVQSTASFVKRDLDEAKKANIGLYSSFSCSPVRTKFLRDVNKMEYERLVMKYQKYIFGKGALLSRIRKMGIRIRKAVVRRVKKLLKCIE